MNKVMSRKVSYPFQETTDWGFYIDIEKCHSSFNTNDEMMRAKYKVISDHYYHKYELNKDKVEINDSIKKIEMNDTTKKIEINDINRIEISNVESDKSKSILFQISSLTIGILSCYYILWIL